MSLCTGHLKKRMYYTVDFFNSLFIIFFFGGGGGGGGGGGRGGGRGGLVGWIICDFTSYSTVFQLYQDDDRMIMKGFVQWNPIYSRGDSRLERGSIPGPLDR